MQRVQLIIPLSDCSDHVGTAVLAPVAELEALPEDGVVAELVPEPADGQHRADDVAGRQVREDLDEDLLGKTVDVQTAPHQLLRHH